MIWYAGKLEFFSTFINVSVTSTAAALKSRPEVSPKRSVGVPKNVNVHKLTKFEHTPAYVPETCDKRSVNGGGGACGNNHRKFLCLPSCSAPEKQCFPPIFSTSKSS